jgi:DNA-binding response OmpR family regulator
VATSFGDAVESCAVHWPQVVIVDLSGPPTEPARETLEWLRFRARIPIISVTSPGDLACRLLAVQLGVDDHAVAPVDPIELVVRAQALLRRASRSRARIAGDVLLDPAARRAVRRGRTVALTPNEYVVLERLISQPDRVVSKDELLDALGGTGRSPNAVEVHVSAVRRKLESAGPPVIHTVHRGGYLFRPVLAPEHTDRGLTGQP